MRHLLLFFLFALFVPTLYAQELDTALQSNETLHPFYLPYTGSEYQVDANYYYILNEMAEWLERDTTVTLLIRGHVCCGPAYRLSKRRAKKVYKYLLSAGAPKSRLSYKGYSDTCPKRWPERTDEDTALNRRVDFVIRKMH